MYKRCRTLDNNIEPYKKRKTHFFNVSLVYYVLFYKYEIDNTIGTYFNIHIFNVFNLDDIAYLMSCKYIILRLVKFIVQKIHILI